jgi:hypothetical protein
MKEYRLVIETLKECISDLLASGSLDQSILSTTLLELQKAQDKAIINGNSHKEIDDLINDINYVKFEL